MERELAMMLLLVLDVGHGRLDARWAHREGAIAILPMEA
jgi:hypothetical protein